MSTVLESEWGENNKKRKRKREGGGGEMTRASNYFRVGSSSRTTSLSRSTAAATSKGARQRQGDIRAAFGGPLAPPPPASQVDEHLRTLIQSSSLTPFRKRVLLALCQVPKGQVSTYLALANFLQSSPRAVGNALRNNPSAPRVPCHRIVAAGGGIGGFGGCWGKEGKFFGEKVRLLRDEGVQVNEKEGKLKGPVWERFGLMKGGEC
ncbi:MAG: hypothetical protein Q9163_000030 [Psora crenata]